MSTLVTVLVVMRVKNKEETLWVDGEWTHNLGHDAASPDLAQCEQRSEATDLK